MRIEQAPEVMVGRVLAHVRRGGEQQHVAARPRQPGEIAVRRGATGQGFGQLVAKRLARPAILRRSGQFVRFIEDHEIIGWGVGTAQSGKQTLADQRIQRDDDQVAARAAKGVAGARVGPGDDAERQSKQRAHLPLPVADEAGRRHDKHAPNAPPGEHLAHRQAGHDGFPGAGVVGEQEP